MKPIIKLLFILSFSAIVLHSCGEDETKEAHYMGVWKINQYNVSGYDNTESYIQTHRDYSIYVKPGHVFSETWMEGDDAKNITGRWDITENGKNIVLVDNEFGQRKYDLNYMYTLRFKNGPEELILRKI